MRAGTSYFGGFVITTREVIPTVPTGGAEIPRGPERDRAPFLRFLALTLVFVVIGFVAAFPLVRSSLYPKWRERQWGPMLDFAFHPGAENADVVIFGDSSAFIGVDPRLLNSQLGLRTLLLPNTIGSLPVTGDIPLDRYLAHHAPPRLLVLYFSPWNLDYTQVKEAVLFEGEEMMFRNGTRSEILSFVLHHPYDTLVFPFRLFNTYGEGILREAAHRPNAGTASSFAMLGHMDDTEVHAPLKAACQLPKDFLRQRNETSVETLAQHYATRVPVLVYLAPIPDCAGAQGVTQWSYSAVHAASPTLLPKADFVGDHWYAHMRPDAVPLSTHLLGQAVAQRLGLAATTSIEQR